MGLPAPAQVAPIGLATAALADPTPAALFKTMSDLAKDIPDLNAVTQRELRRRTAEVLGLKKDGLDSKKALFAR